MPAPYSGPIDLTGKVAIVSGASRGIGRAISETLAREGASVAIIDVLSTADTTLAVEATGRESLNIPCDIQKKADIQKAIDQVSKTWGHIDVLVNNAAVLDISFFCELPRHKRRKLNIKEVKQEYYYGD
ncbi:MAG: SDR family NAD(P)-dependent oxidoreductase [Deltaproteobacteria bacterium]|nr:SDR family NAD(P)-dependent oxidoreductase [Deltaproteobacteria bacterium]